MHAFASILPNQLVERLHPAARVTVLSGAGISAASGIPTFRGNDGLWKKFRAEELATPEAFARDPLTVWEWYGWRRDLVREAQPNPAHHALVHIARSVERLEIITQNVDSLHARADDRIPVHEMHGSLFVLRCTRCGEEREDRGPGPAPGQLPHCRCGGLQRPGVVWFGEGLDPRVLDACDGALRHCDVLLVVGTSGMVQPAAGLSHVARAHGAFVANFNLDSAHASADVHAVVPGPCEETLPALVHALHHRQGGGPG